MAGDLLTNGLISPPPRFLGLKFILISSDADLNKDGQLDLLEASLYLFESGKITEEDHQKNKLSTGQPEWFTEIDTNQDEFIQLHELDNRYSDVGK